MARPTMLPAKQMGDYLRFKRTLGPRLNEMVNLITAREWTQQYACHAHHPAVAAVSGMSQASWPQPEWNLGSCLRQAQGQAPRHPVAADPIMSLDTRFFDDSGKMA